MVIRIVQDVTLELCSVVGDADVVWQRSFRVGEVHLIGEYSRLTPTSAVLEFVSLAAYTEVSDNVWVFDDRLRLSFLVDEISLN